MENDLTKTSENEKSEVKISRKLTTGFSKGANKGNAPDPELIMLKIKEQQEKNKRGE